MPSLKPFQIILASALLVISSATAVMAQSEQLYTKLTIEQVMGIMSQNNLEVQRVKDNEEALAWNMGDDKYAIISKVGPYTLNFYTYAKKPNITFEAVNEWNSDYSFSKTYIDSAKDVVLELDLDYEGGVTKDRIASFFRVCSMSHEIWQQKVIAK